MSNHPLALIIAVNPGQYQGEDESSDRADIEAHAQHERMRRAVYWCIPAAGNGSPRWKNNVRTVYFYQSESKKVTHRANIDRIWQRSDISEEERELEERFVFGSRREKLWDLEDCVEYYGPSYEDKCRNIIWIRIREIRPLSRPRELGEFRKTSDNERVKLVRNYVVVHD